MSRATTNLKKRLAVTERVALALDRELRRQDGMLGRRTWRISVARTYERLGHELDTDVILVCRKCHKPCDARRRRQNMEVSDKNELDSNLHRWSRLSAIVAA